MLIYLKQWKTFTTDIFKSSKYHNLVLKFMLVLFNFSLVGEKNGKYFSSDLKF